LNFERDIVEVLGLIPMDAIRMSDRPADGGQHDDYYRSHGECRPELSFESGLLHSYLHILEGNTGELLNLCLDHRTDMDVRHFCSFGQCQTVDHHRGYV